MPDDLEDEARGEIERVGVEPEALRARHAGERGLLGDALALVGVGPGAAPIVGVGRVLRPLVAEAKGAGQVVEALERGLGRERARLGLGQQRRVGDAVIVIGDRHPAGADRA